MAGNIVEYTNQVDTLHPSELGAEAYAQLGRRVGVAYKEIGQDVGGAVQRVANEYEQHVTNQEISKGVATHADIWDGLTKGWNDALKNADPNDPSTAQKYVDEIVKPTLENFQQGFSTPEAKKWAQAQSAQLGQHFLEKTSADMSLMAGHAAVENHKAMVNSFSEMAMNDPASTDTILGAMEGSVKATLDANPNLSATERASMSAQMVSEGKSQVVKGAMYGAATANPDKAQEILASGKYGQYLTESDTKMLSGYADTVRAHKEEAVRQQAAAQHLQEVREAKTAEKDIFESAIGKDGLFHPNADTLRLMTAYATMPGADPEGVKAFQGMMRTAREDAVNGTLTVSNPTVVKSLLGRLDIPSGTPGSISNAELARAYEGHQLSNHDFNVIRESRDRIATDPETKASMARITAAVTKLRSTITSSDPTTGAGDPLGQQRYAQFSMDVQRKAVSMLGQGKTASEVEDELLNSNSPNYLARHIAVYAPTKDQASKALNDWAAGRATPYTPVYDPYLSAGNFARTTAPKPTGAAAAFVASRVKKK